MRKYISLVCTVVLFIMCLIQPVSAAEVGSVGCVDLLSMGYITVNGSNVQNMRIDLSSNRSGTVWFPVDISFALGEFELLIMTSDPSLTFKRSDNAVTYTKVASDLGQYYYVVRGTLSGRGKTLNYTSSGSGSGDYCFILSAKALPQGYSVVDIPFDFQVFDAALGSGYQIVDAQDVYTYEFYDEFYYDEFDDMYQRAIRIYPDKEALAGLDYFDLDIYLENLEIESVSASFKGNALDVSYTEQFIGDGIFNDPIQDGAYDKDKTYGVYKVVIRVDVSGINLLEGLPTVFINYNSNNYGSVRPYVYVYGINAGKFWRETEPEISFLYRIWNSITSGFSNTVSSLSSGFSNTISSISTGFTNTISAIGSGVTSITNSLVSNFDRLGIWLTNQNTLIANKCNELYNMMVSKFDALHAAILGKKDDGEELSSGAQQIQDSVDNISRFEEDQQAILDNNFTAIQNAVTITGFAASLAFVQRYTEGIFLGMGNTFIIFSLPLFLGLFFFICSRIPGATRWLSRPPKDGDG